MTVDVNSILLALIAGVFSILGVVVPMMVSKYVGDEKARNAINDAVTHSLGAIQQAIAKGVPQDPIPGVSPSLTAGVRYVMTHEPSAVARRSLTPTLIAEKISAQQGLHAIPPDIAPIPTPTTALLYPSGGALVPTPQASPLRS